LAGLLKKIRHLGNDVLKPISQKRSVAFDSDKTTEKWRKNLPPETNRESHDRLPETGLKRKRGVNDIKLPFVVRNAVAKEATLFGHEGLFYSNLLRGLYYKLFGAVIFAMS
jgi:hypothetical protein